MPVLAHGATTIAASVAMAPLLLRACAHGHVRGVGARGRGLHVTIYVRAAHGMMARH